MGTLGISNVFFAVVLKNYMRSLIMMMRPNSPNSSQIIKQVEQSGIKLKREYRDQYYFEEYIQL